MGMEQHRAAGEANASVEQRETLYGILSRRARELLMGSTPHVVGIHPYPPCLGARQIGKRTNGILSITAGCSKVSPPQTYPHRPIGADSYDDDVDNECEEERIRWNGQFCVYAARNEMIQARNRGGVGRSKGGKEAAKSADKVAQCVWYGMPRTVVIE
jgi:hypothetical protein